MQLIRLSLLIVLVFGLGQLKGQDIHFTQFQMSPHTLNPAMTGGYEGTFRIGGIYRDQYASVIGKQFVTPSAYVDAPLFSVGKKDWVGGGLMVVNDKVGTSALTKLTAMLSLAYHKGIGAKSNTYISLGIQGGIVQKKLDQNDLVFEDQLIGGGGISNPNPTSIDLSNFASTNVTYPDFQAGIHLNSYLSSKVAINVGFSAYHLLSPEDIFFNTPASGVPGANGNPNNLPRRYQAHAGADVDITTKWVLKPAVLFQTQAGARELNMQTMFGYHLNDQKDVTLLFGGGYRLDDAALALLGFDYKGLKIGAAYDVNTSGLTALSSYRGGWEVAASYTAKIYRTPVVKPIIFCPRF